MKLSVAVLACALVASALARPEVNQEAAQVSKNRLDKAHEGCQSNPATAVDKAALRELIKSGGPRPANFAAHSLCISKALGWQNEDGEVNKSVIEAGAISIFGQNANVQKLVDDCTVAKPTAEETAISLLACYKKNAPHF